MKKILIAGAGQIGSRHLQGLARSVEGFEITLLDPSAENLDTAVARFKEVSGNQSHEVIRCQHPGQLPDHCDLAIIASTAVKRADILMQLINHTEIRSLILEKVLFQELSDYDRVGKLLAEKKIPAWVNCPRRIYPFYREIKKELDSFTSLNLTVTGGNWGLGCNGLHFLDLFHYLTGSMPDFMEFHPFSPPFPAKREGFTEFSGILWAGNGERSMNISIQDHMNGTNPPLLEISSDTFRYIIIESQGFLGRYSKRSKKTEMTGINVPYQSELTHLVAVDILENQSCGLIGYEESSKLHRLFIKTLLDHFNQFSDEPLTKLPIT